MCKYVCVYTCISPTYLQNLLFNASSRVVPPSGPVLRFRSPKAQWRRPRCSAKHPMCVNGVGLHMCLWLYLWFICFFLMSKQTCEWITMADVQKKHRGYTMNFHELPAETCPRNCTKHFWRAKKPLRVPSPPHPASWILAMGWIQFTIYGTLI